MNIDLAEMENINNLCCLHWMIHHQVHLHHHLPTKERWRLLACLKEQKGTKSISEQTFSERKPHTLKQKKRMKKTPRPITRPYQTGPLPPASPICKAPMQGACCGKETHAAAEHV
jgi:hypothetical protein